MGRELTHERPAHQGSVALSFESRLPSVVTSGVELCADQSEAIGPQAAGAERGRSDPGPRGRSARATAARRPAPLAPSVPRHLRGGRSAESPGAAICSPATSTGRASPAVARGDDAVAHALASVMSTRARAGIGERITTSLVRRGRSGSSPDGGMPAKNSQESIEVSGGRGSAIRRQVLQAPGQHPLDFACLPGELSTRNIDTKSGTRRRERRATISSGRGLAHWERRQGAYTTRTACSPPPSAPSSTRNGHRCRPSGSGPAEASRPTRTGRTRRATGLASESRDGSPTVGWRSGVHPGRVEVPMRLTTSALALAGIVSFAPLGVDTAGPASDWSRFRGPTARAFRDHRPARRVRTGAERGVEDGGAAGHSSPVLTRTRVFLTAH